MTRSLSSTVFCALICCAIAEAQPLGKSQGSFFLARYFARLVYMLTSLTLHVDQDYESAAMSA